MVHRPFRLVDIINTCSKYKLEAKRMRFVYPYVDKEPNMVLVECIKGGGRNLIACPPLIVYKKPGVYTEEIIEIYGY
jgi:tRNA1(Val) A37 N6-methylase TrmN6